MLGALIGNGVISAIHYIKTYLICYGDGFPKPSLYIWYVLIWFYRKIKMQEKVDRISNNLFLALQQAKALQAEVFEAEGDSDLNRKLTSYLIPNLVHWLEGSQAGGVKDLNDTLEKRQNAKNRN